MSGRIFHLIEAPAWRSAQQLGQVTPPSLLSEGFVHCSSREQVVGTIERHFDGIDHLVLLELDADVLGDDLCWEESRPGEAYPHLYRPIDPLEIIAAYEWSRSADGSVHLPPGM